ncbi:MAG TPA: hypothetical protein VNM34_01715 [Verrucomicrobiae bacterium]|nr:hypothetical protein [Verrucomicrobiae bacterium]
MRHDRAESGGVAVLRAWLEAGPEPSLRVRMTEMAALSSRDGSTAVVASADEACTLVRGWLGRLIEAERHGPEDSGDRR